ncbi:hypothetical protein PR202_gb06690 [Eleusine coracana subsp. coracana]|uniref:UspA domain-containing protein n=1 Tax=Eleusine coracana subsp. coracana TaxID=191504 RepID=A0AAV5E9F2_ELECO|nr:hypothetical protein PR202_gb06690 [Eleusine coracana subsp. coracana]
MGLAIRARAHAFPASPRLPAHHAESPRRRAQLAPRCAVSGGRPAGRAWAGPSPRRCARRRVAAGQRRARTRGGPASSSHLGPSAHLATTRGDDDDDEDKEDDRKLAGDRPGGGRGPGLSLAAGTAGCGQLRHGAEARRAASRGHGRRGQGTSASTRGLGGRAASTALARGHRRRRAPVAAPGPCLRSRGRSPAGGGLTAAGRAPPVGVLAERRRSSSPERGSRRLFLGGPDDREAAYADASVAARGVATDGVTLCRFRFPVPSAPPLGGGRGGGRRRTRRFMADLHARMVVTGQVEYTERHVAGGAEMVDALRDVARAYSLVVVGRSGGSAGAQAMARGMGDWLGDDFLELGPVGEVLASDDFRDGGSVLVLQLQHPRPGSRNQDPTTTQQQSTPPPCPC